MLTLQSTGKLRTNCLSNVQRAQHLEFSVLNFYTEDYQPTAF